MKFLAYWCARIVAWGFYVLAALSFFILVRALDGEGPSNADVGYRVFVIAIMLLAGGAGWFILNKIKPQRGVDSSPAHEIVPTDEQCITTGAAHVITPISEPIAVRITGLWLWTIRLMQFLFGALFLCMSWGFIVSMAARIGYDVSLQESTSPGTPPEVEISLFLMAFSGTIFWAMGYSTKQHVILYSNRMEFHLDGQWTVSIDEIDHIIDERLWRSGGRGVSILVHRLAIYYKTGYTRRCDNSILSKKLVPLIERHYGFRVPEEKL